MQRTSHDVPDDGLLAPCDSAEFFLLGLLNHDEEAAFEAHLTAGCPGCEKRLSHHVETIAQLAGQQPAAASLELRERLLAKLQKPKPAKPAAQKPEVVFDHLGLLVVRSAAMNWQASPVQGVWIKPLFVDEERMYATTLVRLQPGVHYPPHRHAEIEEVYILAGDLKFKNLELCQGDYCRAEGGTAHTESFSKNGCLLLITTSIHDQFLPNP